MDIDAETVSEEGFEGRNGSEMRCRSMKKMTFEQLEHNARRYHKLAKQNPKLARAARNLKHLVNLRRHRNKKQAAIGKASK